MIVGSLLYIDCKTPLIALTVGLVGQALNYFILFSSSVASNIDISLSLFALFKCAINLFSSNFLASAKS